MVHARILAVRDRRRRRSSPGCGSNVASMRASCATSGLLHFPQHEAGEDRGAPDVHQQWLSHAMHRAPQHVGVDLAPDIGRRPATDEADGTERPADKLLDSIQHPARVERHAFKDGADHVSARRAQGEVVEGRPDVPVVDWTAFAREPRREHDAVAAGRHGRGEAVVGAIAVRRGRARRAVRPPVRRRCHAATAGTRPRCRDCSRADNGRGSPTGRWRSGASHPFA